MLFQSRNLQIPDTAVSLHCVFHSIRFKVNKGWAQRSPFFMPVRVGAFLSQSLLSISVRFYIRSPLYLVL